MDKKKIEDVPTFFINCINELSNLFHETAVKKILLKTLTIILIHY